MRRRMLQGVAVVVCVLGLVGCQTAKHRSARTLMLLDLPAPARAEVERQLIGGIVKRIEVEKRDGEELYDVEGTLNGKQVEFEITRNGKILSRSESVPYESLPPAVRMAATVYFGTAEQFPASKEIEGGKTFYEVEGKKEGAKVTLKLTDTGTIVEEEKE